MPVLTKAIQGAPGYFIRSDGQVIGKLGKALKPRHARNHLSVCLYIDGKPYDRYIHRLMALAFIPNENEARRKVHHKNDLGSDNRLKNLQWVTTSEHRRLHASSRAARSPYETDRSVLITFHQTGQQQKCHTIMGAGRVVNKNYRNIQRGLRTSGIYQSRGGLISIVNMEKENA